MSRGILLVERCKFFNHKVFRIIKLGPVTTVRYGLLELVSPLGLLLLQVVEFIQHLHLLQTVLLCEVAELLGRIGAALALVHTVQG